MYLLVHPSGINIEIDGNDQFDTLADGLLVLKNMFSLTGTFLISASNH